MILNGCRWCATGPPCGPAGGTGRAGSRGGGRRWIA